MTADTDVFEIRTRTVSVVDAACVIAAAVPPVDAMVVIQ